MKSGKPDYTLLSMPIEEFRRQMLGASRVEILGEAGYDPVADLRESRGVHRKLLSSENDLVRFKAVELDHKIHGTLAPQAVHDATPRFSVNIKLEATTQNPRSVTVLDSRGDPTRVLDTEAPDHHGLGQAPRDLIQPEPSTPAVFEKATPPPPKKKRSRPVLRGSLPQPPRARPRKKS